jgi:hypothetical protein
MKRRIAIKRLIAAALALSMFGGTASEAADFHPAFAPAGDRFLLVALATGLIADVAPMNG